MQGWWCFLGFEEMHHCHDISSKLCEKIEKSLPGSEGRASGIEQSQVYKCAVFWMLRTGAPWHDLPPDYGDWKNTHRRFCRWRDNGIWGKILEIVAGVSDYKWLMCEMPGAVGSNQAISLSKRGGRNFKIHLAMDVNGMLIRAIRYYS
jgi:transposase